MGLISVQAANPTATATAAAAFTMLAHFIKRSPWVVDSKFRRRSPRATASNLQRECNSKHAACLLIATVISVSDAGCVCGSGGGGGACIFRCVCVGVVGVALRGRTPFGGSVAFFKKFYFCHFFPPP